ncbi:UNKNOWN [Stylonychia lemnae]|uniref:Uncharacterized protein n=1 Tax=Stylonychia lemnae TaxID=5949 RepID=A0A078ADV3_STYLE|nr:UNKNOWN [Stylonychia lemnae]|eukprot:CDW80384.1 UNKNOWN [Stylonychia lemnae]
MKLDPLITQEQRDQSRRKDRQLEIRSVNEQKQRFKEILKSLQNQKSSIIIKEFSKHFPDNKHILNASIEDLEQETRRTLNQRRNLQNQVQLNTAISRNDANPNQMNQTMSYKSKKAQAYEKYEDLLLPPLQKIQYDTTNGYQQYFHDYFSNKTDFKQIKQSLNAEEPIDIQDLSYKEMAKYKVLKENKGNKEGLQKFQLLNLRQEKDFSELDIITEKSRLKMLNQMKEDAKLPDYKDTNLLTIGRKPVQNDEISSKMSLSEKVFEDEQMSYALIKDEQGLGLSEKADEEIDSDLNEYWEDEHEDDFKGKDKFMTKLETYLRAHSQRLSTHVQEYLSKNVQFTSKLKARDTINKVFENIKRMYIGEIEQLMTQFGLMRSQWDSMSKELKNAKKICKEQEQQITQRDLLFSVIPSKYIDLVEDLTIIKQDENERAVELVSDAEIYAHNTLLKEPMSFYAGYIQLSMNCKDEIIESNLVQNYLKRVALLKEELFYKQNENQALQTVIEVYIKNFENMNNQISHLETNLRIKINEAEKEQKRFEAKFREVYDDYNRKYSEIKNEYVNYKSLSDLQMSVQEASIAQLTKLNNKMQDDMHLMGLAIKIPKFRHELNAFDLKNATHDEMVAQIQEVIRASKAGSKLLNIIPSALGDHSSNSLVNFSIKSKRQDKKDSPTHFDKYLNNSSEMLIYNNDKDSQMGILSQKALFIAKNDFDSIKNIARNNSQLDHMPQSSLSQLDNIGKKLSDSYTVDELVDSQQMLMTQRKEKHFDLIKTIDDPRTRRLIQTITKQQDQRNQQQQQQQSAQKSPMVSTQVDTSFRNSSRNVTLNRALFKQTSTQRSNSNDLQMTMNSSVLMENGMNFTLGGNFGFMDSSIATRDNNQQKFIGQSKRVQQVKSKKIRITNQSFN